MKVTVTGATGMLGRRARARAPGRGDEVTVLSRDAERARSTLGAEVRAAGWTEPEAGRRPRSRRWRARTAWSTCSASPWPSAGATRQARDPRLARAPHAQPGGSAARAADAAPATLVSQSASGWYGPRGDERVDESEPAADDFLARVCVELGGARRAPRRSSGCGWSRPAPAWCCPRTAERWRRCCRPSRLGVGGPVAGGRPVRAVDPHRRRGRRVALLPRRPTTATGPVNLTAPEPVTNKELSKTLGRVLGRPAIAPVPGVRDQGCSTARWP